VPSFSGHNQKHSAMSFNKKRNRCRDTFESQFFHEDLEIADIDYDFGNWEEQIILGEINSSFELSDDDYSFEDTQTLHSLEDPINNLPDTAISLVMQHLSGTEIRNMLSVSRDWHRELTRTPDFKNKSKLVIKADEISNPDNVNFMTMMKSRREYSNIEVFANNDKKAEKKIDKLLRKFSKTTVNLKISKVGGFNSMLKHPLVFPLLQFLEIQVSCGRLSPNFQLTSNLMSLTVNGVDQDVLRSLVASSPKLTQLKLFENSFISYFTKKMTSKLSLKSLAVFDHKNTGNALSGEFSAHTWSGRERINFMALIKTQRWTLTYLRLDSCCAEDLSDVLKRLEALKTFELNQITGDSSSLKICLHRNIEAFMSSSPSDILLVYVVSSFKRLKKIYLENLNSHQLSFIGRHAKHLKTLYYSWAAGPFNSVEFEKFHPKIKQVKKEKFVRMIDNRSC
jgi:hypothetical protein